MKLYGKLLSRAPRCMWALGEMNVDYEHIPTDHRAGETHLPEFLKINPNGKIPVLVDGDFVLTESMAINLYLAQKYNKLWPSDLISQTRINEWSYWGITEVELPMLTIVRETFFKPAGEVRPEVIKEATEELNRFLKVLDSHLDGRDYLVGDSFSIGDLNVASILKFCLFFQFDFGAHPNVKRWLDDVWSRPVAKKLCDEMVAGAKAMAAQ